MYKIDKQVKWVSNIGIQIAVTYLKSREVAVNGRRHSSMSGCSSSSNVPYLDMDQHYAVMCTVTVHWDAHLWFISFLHIICQWEINLFLKVRQCKYTNLKWQMRDSHQNEGDNFFKKHESNLHNSMQIN